MGYIEIEKNNMYLCFWMEQGQEVKLLQIKAAGPEQAETDIENGKGRKESTEKGKADKADRKSAGRIVEILVPGEKNKSFRGSKRYYDVPQVRLEYMEHQWEKNECGELLIIRQCSEEIMVFTSYQFYHGLSVFSCESEIVNYSDKEIWIDGITSFCYAGLGFFSTKENTAEDLEVYYAHNTWSAECRWEHHTLKELGIIPYGNLCYDRFTLSSGSGFSSGEFLPEGAVFNRETEESLLWQIEHNGSWAVEIGCVIPEYGKSFLEKDYRQAVYLEVFGPEMENGHWSKRLAPKEAFRTVPVTMAVSKGKPEEGFRQLTGYRRKKKQIDSLPVIFNDYMNCLMGNSTTVTLKPYIEKAAQAGCEVFVIDCGWYDSGNWQYTFGTFKESKERYPGGLSEVMSEIRKAGMKPGLWLELESFGIENKMADSIPLDWLFQRNKKPVVDSGRYHLDFRNSAVQKKASEIVAEIVNNYQPGYIKIDYNLCSGLGTDLESCSIGDGLLEHNRHYLRWLLKEKEKYPEIIWENCASGGLRMDYAMLNIMDIQSVSDQEDYRIMAFIASNCAAAVLPEQAGIWSYPRREGDEKETVMNMVSSLLFRIHLGGHLAELSQERFLLVREGISCYKKIRKDIPEGIPFWPLGFHEFDSGWLCFGLHCTGRDYLVVIRREADQEKMAIPFRGERTCAKILYPSRGNMAEILESPGIQGKSVIHMKEKNTGCLLELI